MAAAAHSEVQCRGGGGVCSPAPCAGPACRRGRGVLTRNKHRHARQCVGSVLWLCCAVLCRWGGLQRAAEGCPRHAPHPTARAALQASSGCGAAAPPATPGTPPTTRASSWASCVPTGTKTCRQALCRCGCGTCCLRRGAGTPRPARPGHACRACVPTSSAPLALPCSPSHAPPCTCCRARTRRAALRFWA